MTGTKGREYRELEIESSNHLIAYDSRWVLGRYEEAADHARQAGVGRVVMGQLCWAAGEITAAAEDWLSAAACFLLGTADRQATDLLEQIHQFAAEGKIPAERQDMLAALREHDQHLKSLKQKMRRLLKTFRVREHDPDVAGEQTLLFLQQHVRDLPGYSWLHSKIYSQASALGQHALAARHCAWADTFERGDAHSIALLGFLHIVRHTPDRAV